MSLEILDALESRVREAAETIESLREQVVELSTRVAELETAASSESAGDGKDWPAERAEIERRVALLVERLEALLAG